MFGANKQVTHRSWRGEQGFTLVELLAVTLVVLVLAALGLPYVGEAMDRSRLGKAERDLREIQVALERFYADHGHYPVRLADLVSYKDDQDREYRYLKHTVTFRSPWSPSNKPLYYFYAVDDNRDAIGSMPRAYVLADPGRGASPGYTQGTPAYLHPSGPTPEGRAPNQPAYAWCFWKGTAAGRKTQLTLDEDRIGQLKVTCSGFSPNPSLRAYREKDSEPFTRTEG